mmetsp:Transcript_12002/g.26689  ORF Transcript_12002/g.26689 Transcript_12002/m.26689 type:complete len:210 (-) Transcript_12002:68-697(-)
MQQQQQQQRRRRRGACKRSIRYFSRSTGLLGRRTTADRRRWLSYPGCSTPISSTAEHSNPLDSALCGSWKEPQGSSRAAAVVISFFPTKSLLLQLPRLRSEEEPKQTRAHQTTDQSHGELPISQCCRPRTQEPRGRCRIRQRLDPRDDEQAAQERTERRRRRLRATSAHGQWRRRRRRGHGRLPTGELHGCLEGETEAEGAGGGGIIIL